MTPTNTTKSTPLWLLVEERISDLTSADLLSDSLEQSIQRTAQDLDGSGYNVSLHAGNMLQLRTAVADRIEVGRPLMKDLNEAVAALKLEDVTDPYKATVKIIGEVGEAWPKLKASERKPDVLRIVEKTRLDLLIARAKELDGEQGIRFLIEEDVDSVVVIEALSIQDSEFARVNALVKAERAERVRVQGLIDAAEGKSDEDKVKELISNNASDELIIELGGFDRGLVDSAKKAMEEEIKEQQRLAEEEAARKKAEAEGPSLDAIPSDELLELIESVREILEFSDKEEEIRTMCGQSSIPKALIDIAVTDPSKLDEMEEKANG
jgi:hypothetical protein